jgi:uncharacterized protein (TIGR00251 family)
MEISRKSMMLLHIKVKPNSSKQKIEKLDEENYLVHLKSRPQNNKANIELINFLSREFKTPHKNINIKVGKISDKKIVEIT